jgi:hypothetical protein
VIGDRHATAPRPTRSPIGEQHTEEVPDHIETAATVIQHRKPQGGAAHRNATRTAATYPRSDIRRWAASCGTGLAEGQCCLSSLGGLVYPAPGEDPADFDSCVNQVHFGDPPGGHVDQVDRREYSGSTHAESAGLTNAAGG